MQNASEIAILIPAWQPDSVLVELVAELSQHHAVVVLDDGSDEVSRRVFEELPEDNVRLLRHAVNLGKGRALKSCFNCILTEYPHMKGVVTADADGQHTVADILRVAQTLTEAGVPVLGSRGFQKSVPFRNRFGNALTRCVFRWLTGAKLHDTQSGLRGFPVSLLAELMTLEGEWYEYEMNVLAHLCRSGRRPLEVPIETVYLESNRSSHFHPVWDSMRIYFVLARLCF